MTRPMVACPDCPAVLRMGEGEKEQERVNRHKKLGDCRPPRKAAPPVAKKKTPSVKSSLGGGWDF